MASLAGMASNVFIDAQTREMLRLHQQAIQQQTMQQAWPGVMAGGVVPMPYQAISVLPTSTANNDYAGVAVMERTPDVNLDEGFGGVALMPPKVKGVPAVVNAKGLVEYQKVAKAIGVTSPGIDIEFFKAFLVAKDMPVFDLKEVVAYMDDKAKREGDGYGWHWLPLRQKDTEKLWCAFGTRAAAGSHSDMAITPASDYYEQGYIRSLYEHTVPLHALKKVEAIEREYRGGTVAFVVSDYATQPHYKPDPFLMAVVPNLHAKDGTGRFVIDFWDEPGFGIEKQIK